MPSAEHKVKQAIFPNVNYYIKENILIIADRISSSEKVESTKKVHYFKELMLFNVLIIHYVTEYR